MEKPRIRPLFYCILLITLVLAVLHYRYIYTGKSTIPAPVISPQKNTSPQTENSPLIIDEELYETFKIQEEGPYTTIDVSYPRFKLLSTLEDDKIENMYRTFIKEHTQVSRDNFQARFDTMSEEEKKNYQPAIKKEDKYNAYGSFTIIQANENFISVLFSYGGYQGGAHGFEVVSSLNYDIKKKKHVSLEYLFPLEKDVLGFLSEQSRVRMLTTLVPTVTYKKNFTEISDAVVEQVVPQITPTNESTAGTESENSLLQPEKTLLYSEQEINLTQMIYDGTTPERENFSVYTFTPTQVTLYFGEYQVAPYVYGRQQIVFPRNNM